MKYFLFFFSLFVFFFFLLDHNQLFVHIYTCVWFGRLPGFACLDTSLITQQTSHKHCQLISYLLELRDFSKAGGLKQC